MNELKAFDFNGQKVIDSRDVAVMVERNHWDLLRNIRNYIDYLRESNFAFSDFFIESFYFNAQNHKKMCYLITKKGCDLIANKLTGKKGVLFTAAYVTAFEEMKQAIIKPVEVSPGGFGKAYQHNQTGNARYGLHSTRNWTDNAKHLQNLVYSCSGIAYQHHIRTVKAF